MDAYLFHIRRDGREVLDLQVTICRDDDAARHRAQALLLEAHDRSRVEVSRGEWSVAVVERPRIQLVQGL